MSDRKLTVPTLVCRGLDRHSPVCLRLPTEPGPAPGFVFFAQTQGVLEILNGRKIQGGDGTCAIAADPLDPTGTVLHTLKLPIQTPASPDGKWVATAVFSLASGVTPDTIALIDANANDGAGALVAEFPCPAGCHGVNWGAKLGGGYYAYVTSQHSNRLMVFDPDPNGDGNPNDAAIAGHVVLRTASDPLLPTDPTIGTGGQGILPIPLVKDGWIQDTVAEWNDGNTSAEITGFINVLTPGQRNP